MTATTRTGPALDRRATRSSAGRPVNANPELQRERILQAALGHFARHGFGGTSLRMIAADAGVTHGLIRHYFSNKEELFHATADYLFGQVAEALEQHQNGGNGSDAITQLEMQIRAFVRLSARMPHLAGFLMQAGLDGGDHFDYVIEKHVRPLYEQALRPYLTAVSEGTAQAMDPDFLFMIATHAATAPFAQAAVRKAISGRDMYDPEIVDAYADALIRVLLGGLLTDAQRKQRGF